MEMPQNFSTPSNTVGMGNPIAPGENGEVGSGDVLTIQNDQKPKKKKMKSLKNYLKNKIG